MPQQCRNSKTVERRLGLHQPGFGLDAVEQSSPAMKDFDLFDFDFKTRAKASS
jgi:hypothetical protein